MTELTKKSVPLHPQFCKSNTIFYFKQYESIRNRFHFDSRFV